MKAEKSQMMCSHGVCSRCHAAKLLVLGVLVLLNAAFALVKWPTFIGGLLVLGGILMLIKPKCPHCS